jgi:hypothetical protein
MVERSYQVRRGKVVFAVSAKVVIYFWIIFRAITFPYASRPRSEVAAALRQQHNDHTMARTSKTAEGRSKVAAMKEGPPAKKQKVASASAAAPKKKKKKEAAVEKKKEEEEEEEEEAGGVKRKETKEPTPRATTKKAGARSSSTARSAAAAAAPPKARRALGNISVNVDSEDDVKCEGGKFAAGKKLQKTTKTKIPATANPAHGRGRNRGRTEGVVYKEEGTSESDPEEDDDDEGEKEDAEEEEESDYEDKEAVAPKKTKKTAASATTIKKKTTTMKKKASPKKKAAPKTGGGGVRGKKKKTGRGAVSVLEVLEEEVTPDRDGVSSPDVIRNFTQKFASGVPPARETATSALSSSSATTKRDHGARTSFDNVEGHARRPTAMYEEEYRPDSNDDWRCMSAVDW